MRLRSAIGPAVLLAAGCLGSIATDAAEIYKWKDEKGVVHYSNTPPPKDANASVLDESKGKVSVVPAYKAPDGAAKSDAALQDRVRRLERDLERERQSQSAASQSQSDAYARWREECLAQRRSDCDDPNAAVAPVYGEGGYYYPPVVRPPGPSRPNRPSGAPPGYTVGPGPGGIGGAYVPNPPRPLPNGNDPLPAPRPVPRPVPVPR